MCGSNDSSQCVSGERKTKWKRPRWLRCTQHKQRVAETLLSFAFAAKPPSSRTNKLSDSGGRSEVFRVLLILDYLSDDLYLYMGGEIDARSVDHTGEYRSFSMVV